MGIGESTRYPFTDKSRRSRCSMKQASRGFLETLKAMHMRPSPKAHSPTPYLEWTPSTLRAMDTRPSPKAHSPTPYLEWRAKEQLQQP